jgi:hypothetical protein
MYYVLDTKALILPSCAIAHVARLLQAVVLHHHKDWRSDKGVAIVSRKRSGGREVVVTFCTSLESAGVHQVLSRRGVFLESPVRRKGVLEQTNRDVSIEVCVGCVGAQRGRGYASHLGGT